jgi:radical SAM protein with 4Fe4S-binding SPASM domain
MPNDTVSFNGNRILSFYKDAKILKAGGMVIPRMVSCWLTHRCNLNCDYCLYTESHNKFGDMVDTEKFLRFIDEIVELGVESIEFGGGGEPTVHKDCFKIAKYAHDKGLQVGMLTNAARFDIPLALESFRYIRLGVDAHEDGLYQIVKGTTAGTFAKTEKNCFDLIAARNDAGLKAPRIGVKHLIGRKNVGFLAELVAWAKSIDADYVHFKAEHNSPAALTPEERIEYGAVLDELKNKYSGFVKGDLNFLTGKHHCFMADIHAVLDAKGNLNQCCYFTEKQDQIGNVFDDGFLTVWKSAKHAEVKGNKTVDGCNKFDCRWHLYNNQAVEMLEGTEQDLAFI